MKLIFSQSLYREDEIHLLVEKIKPYLKAKSVLLLEGNLGVGKTTFVNYLLRSFNYTLSSSPTYALRNTYEILGASFDGVEHIDLYRVSSEDEIESVGFWDVFNQPENLVLIEWPERVDEKDWPMSWSQYKLKIFKKDNEYIYEFYFKNL